ncbi:borealin-like [Sceloporus undulatus]|uniref:borealin-like n=1 Tax=Sceloporus undulatus TaxID=8520 RepID=UPI001C4CDDC7|nr:borealin-like [Sceloporus undulatus]
MYAMAFLRLPVAVRETNWLSYCAGGEMAQEKLALADFDIEEIIKLASEAIQTPMKTCRKGRKKPPKYTIGSINEEVECPVRVPGPSEQDPNMLQELRKGKGLTKKPLTSKKSSPPSLRSTRFNQSTDSNDNLFTSVGQVSHSTATTIQTLIPAWSESLDCGPRPHRSACTMSGSLPIAAFYQTAKTSSSPFLLVEGRTSA